MPSSAARLSKRYAELKLPVRIIAGSEDKIITTSQQSARLNAELPNSKIQIVDAVGHMTHHARPDLVTAAVNDLTPRDAVSAEPISFDLPPAHRRAS